jgi:hypothetical protein
LYFGSGTVSCGVRWLVQTAPARRATAYETNGMISSTPIPPVPWQITGNHWVAVPCIHPADGAIHALGVLHRGSRSAVEFAGCHFVGRGPAAALLEREPVPLAEGRGLGAGLRWIPTFTSAVGDRWCGPISRHVDGHGGRLRQAVRTAAQRAGGSASRGTGLASAGAHPARVKTIRVRRGDSVP